MSMVLFWLICLFETLGLTTAVTLQRAGDALFGNQFCPGSTAEYKCQTTEGSLLWQTSDTPENFSFDNMTQSQKNLGIFLLRVDGVSVMNGMVLAVNSTAVVSDVQPSYNGTVLKCFENADLSMFSEAVLRVAGPPPAPAVNPITVVGKGSIDSTFLISWSQSNCAVQYVVTVINSSDDRVYPNITNSNTITAVTLPTGVEFCVTLVAVDSIDRRGPDSVPQCYKNMSPISPSVNQLFTPSPAIMSNIDQIVTSSSTSSAVSVTITVTPVEGGVNAVVGLLVAIIIIVVLVCLVIVVILAARLCYKQQKGASKPLEMESKESRADGEDTIRKYKVFLKDYYQDPLPNDDKLFVSNRNKLGGYAELDISEKDAKPTPEMEKKNGKDKSQSIVALNDILTPHKKEKPVQLVLIEGTSGIGKTTLAWQLCHKWAKEELDSLKGYDLVILVRLRKKRAQKATKLEHLLPYDNTTDMKGLIAAIGKGERVLIVCDGFDELPCRQQESEFYIRLFSGDLLPAATVIVTTRPTASDVFKKKIDHNIHRELEITGFTRNGITEFVKSIFNAAALGGFQSYIQNNPPINSMMYLPLSAVIVATIYQESYKTDTPFPNTMSELFDAFARVLVRRHLESIDQEITMPSSLQDISKLPRVASQFFKIVEIAYDGICDNLYVFNELPEDFEHLELMRKIIRETIARGRHTTFVFFHYTLQEYLAALHIANHHSRQLDSLELQLKKKDMHMITRFLAGICHNNRNDYCSNLRQWLVEFLCQICFDRSRALQLVHCAYECPSIMHNLEVEYNEKNTFIVVEPEVGIDWYAMGYCISQFDEKWGLHTTGLRKKNIDLLEKGLKPPPMSELPPTSRPPPTVSGTLKYLHISKSEVPVSAVFNSLRKSCQLECLELLYVKIDENDEEAIKKLISAKSGPERLTYQIGNEHTHTTSLIPMLLGHSSLKKLAVRTGSVVNMDTELLPCTNTNLKKLTISRELVQPLKALLPNTSLTCLVIDSQVYDSDLPMLKSLITSLSTLKVLKLGKIVDYASTPKPTPLTSASHNLQQLVKVACNCRQLMMLKLHQEDYDYLPEYHNNPTVCSR